MIRSKVGLLALSLCAGLVVLAAPVSAGVEPPVASPVTLCPMEPLFFMLQTGSSGVEPGPGGGSPTPAACGQCSFDDCLIVGDSCDLGDGRMGKCDRSTYACPDGSGNRCYCKARSEAEIDPIGPGA